MAEKLSTYKREIHNLEVSYDWLMVEEERAIC